MASARLEEFLDLVQISINQLADKYSNAPEEFIRILTRRSENIKGETRDYYDELGQDPIKIKRYVLDMLGKVEHVEKKYFEKEDGIFNYSEIANSIRYSLNKHGNIHEIFAFHIFETIQEIKNYYRSYLHDSCINSNRKTKFPSFSVKKPNVLNDAFSQLIKFGYIAADTQKKDFVDIFTGRVINNRVVWIGDNNALAYFIRGIIKKKAIYPVGKDHWIIIQKCFVIRGLVDYETDILRNSDPPEDPDSLNLIIDSFNHS